MIKKIVYLLFGLILFSSPTPILASCSSCDGATPSCAAGTSSDDVETCVSTMTLGGTLTLASGDYTWSDYVAIARGVTITGAGPTSTVISNSTRTFDIDGPGSGDFVIKNLGITGSSSTSSDISINGGWDKMVVQNVAFSSLAPRAFDLGYNTSWGAINGWQDHQKILISQISTTSSDPYNVYHPAIKIYGRNKSWEEDDGWGGDNYVYIEGSTFTWTSTSYGTVTDVEFGGRFVARYNTLINGIFTTHDTASTPHSRGTRQYELYNNYGNRAGTAYGFTNFNRGGSAIVYGNVLEGVGYLTSGGAEIARLIFTGGFLHRCELTDGRKACQDAFVHCVAGTNLGHPCTTNGQCGTGGVCGTKICRSGTNIFGACTTVESESADCPDGLGGYGACQLSYLCTQNSDCKDKDGNNGLCMQLDGLGAPEGAPTGYPCRDQEGCGKDDPVTGQQARNPSYWYSNTLNGSPLTPGDPGGAYTGYIIADRDYCNHDTSTTCGAKDPWSYTPYTCPHPWASLTGTYCDTSIAGVSGYGLTGGRLSGGFASGGLVSQ